MIKKWLLSLRRIGGRIDTVKLLRDICLIVFTLIFSITLPFLNDLLRLGSQNTLQQVFYNPVLWIVIAMPFVALLMTGFYIKKIDDWEDKKANGRWEKQQELLNDIKSEIHMLTSEIRQSRKKQGKNKNRG